MPKPALRGSLSCAPYACATRRRCPASAPPRSAGGRRPCRAARCRRRSRWAPPTPACRPPPVQGGAGRSAQDTMRSGAEMCAERRCRHRGGGGEGALEQLPHPTSNTEPRYFSAYTSGRSGGEGQGQGGKSRVLALGCMCGGSGSGMAGACSPSAMNTGPRLMLKSGRASGRGHGRSAGEGRLPRCSSPAQPLSPQLAQAPWSNTLRSPTPMQGVFSGTQKMPSGRAELICGEASRSAEGCRVSRGPLLL